MVFHLLSQMAFIVLPYKPGATQIYLLTHCQFQPVSSITSHTKFDGAKAKLHSYVPNIRWWPLTPANIYW